MASAAEAGRQGDFMRAMLVLKMGCQHWLEDHGGDTSGFVYKSVKDRSRCVLWPRSPRGGVSISCRCGARVLREIQAVRQEQGGILGVCMWREGKKKLAEQEKERLKERASTIRVCLGLS